MYWAGRYPLLRLLVPFVAGILAVVYFKPPVHIPLVALVLSSALLSVIMLTGITQKYRFRWLFGALLTTAFLSFGMVYSWVRSEGNRPHHFAKTPSPPRCLCEALGSPVEKAKTFKIPCRMLAVLDSASAWKAVDGKLMVYLKKDEAAKKIRFGDRILFSATPQPVPGPGNPAEFNYRRYLAHQGITHQVFVATGKWTAIEKNVRNLKSVAIDLRDRLVGVLHAAIGSKNEFAVASALVLGYEEHINDELTGAYSGAGVMHVLAVSGLHVGVVFLALSIMFSWMDRFKATRHLKNLALIALIWFYALLTGLSPSVLRASAMLTFIILGNWSRRETEVGNSILASAFFLLLWDPYLLVQVGFQLSYLAVFGICYLHPLIYRQWEPSNYYLHKAWELGSVSAAAQLMTFPLAVYYFHQFPNLFFISNLVVIPLATAAIYCGMLTLFLAALGNTLKLLIAGCFGFVYCMNQAVLYIEKLPFSMLSGLWPSVAEILLVYLAIVLLWLFFVRKNGGWFIAALAVILGLMASQMVEEHTLAGQKKFVVYRVPGHRAIDFITGRDHWFEASEKLPDDNKLMNFHVRPHWGILGLRPAGPSAAPYLQNGFAYFQGRSFYVADRTMPKRRDDSPTRMRLDCLVLSGGHYQNVKNLLRYFNPKRVVIDASYTPWRAGKLREECKSLEIACHSVMHDGAFVMEL